MEESWTFSAIKREVLLKGMSKQAFALFETKQGGSKVKETTRSQILREEQGKLTKQERIELVWQAIVDDISDDGILDNSGTDNNRINTNRASPLSPQSKATRDLQNTTRSSSMLLQSKRFPLHSGCKIFKKESKDDQDLLMMKRSKSDSRMMHSSGANSKLADSISAQVSSSMTKVCDPQEPQQQQRNNDLTATPVDPVELMESSLQREVQPDMTWSPPILQKYGRQTDESRDSPRVKDLSTQNNYNNTFGGVAGLAATFESSTSFNGSCDGGVDKQEGDQNIETSSWHESSLPAVTVGHETEKLDVALGRTVLGDSKGNLPDERSDEAYTPARDTFPIQQHDQRDEQTAESTHVDSSEFSKHVRVTVVDPEPPDAGPAYQFVLSNSSSDAQQNGRNKSPRRRVGGRNKARSGERDSQAKIANDSCQSESSERDAMSVERIFNMFITVCSADQEDAKATDEASEDPVGILEWAGGAGMNVGDGKRNNSRKSGASTLPNVEGELPGCHYMERVIRETFGSTVSSEQPDIVLSEERYVSHELIRTGKEIHVPPSVVEHAMSFDDDASDITDAVWNETDDETSDNTCYVQLEGDQNDDGSSNDELIEGASDIEQESHVSSHHDSVVERAIDQIFRSEDVSNASVDLTEDDSFAVTTIQLLHGSNSLTDADEMSGSLTRSHSGEQDDSNDDDDDDDHRPVETPQLKKFTNLLDKVVNTFPDDVNDVVPGLAIDNKDEAASIPNTKDTEPDDSISKQSASANQVVATPPISSAETRRDWVASFDDSIATSKEKVSLPLPDDTIGAMISSPLVRSIYKKSDSSSSDGEESVDGPFKKARRRKRRVAWLLDKIRRTRNAEMGRHGTSSRSATYHELGQLDGVVRPEVIRE